MEKLIHDRNSGMTYKDIAIKHKLSESTVSRLFKGHRVKYTYAYIKERNDNIIVDARCMTLVQLTGKYEVSEDTIRRVLNKAGVSLKKGMARPRKKSIKENNRNRIDKKAKKNEPIPTLVRKGEFRKVRVDHKTELYVYATEKRWSLSDEQIIENYNKKYR